MSVSTSLVRAKHPSGHGKETVNVLHYTAVKAKCGVKDRSRDGNLYHSVVRCLANNLPSVASQICWQQRRIKC